MKKNYTKTIFLYFFMLFIVAIFLHFYNTSLYDDLSASTNKTLNEVMEQQKQILNSEFTARSETIKYTANVMSSMLNENTKIEDIYGFLAIASRDIGFREILVAGKSGNAIYSNGQQSNIAEKSYFKSAINGDYFISDIVKSEIDGKNEIMFSAPLFYKGEVVCIIAGAYDTEVFSSMITPIFGGHGSVNVTAKNGDTILSISSDSEGYRNKGGNFFDVFQEGKIKIIEGDSLDTIHRNFKENRTGNVKYTFGDVPRLMAYSPLGINDWFITSIVKIDTFEETTSSIVVRSTILALLMIILFLIIIIYTIYGAAKNARMLEKLAYEDDLTGAPNFAKFKMELRRILYKYPNRSFMVIKMDICKFKSINEVISYDIGDQLIKTVAETLSGFAKSDYTTFGRITADEFVIMDSVDFLPGESRDDIIKKYNEHHQSFLDKMNVDFPFIRGHKLEFRFGRYIVEPGEHNIVDIWEKVNLAHRMSKTQSMGAICDFRPEFLTKFVREVEIENKLADALQNDEFKLFVQPKFRINDERIVGGEALVRWFPVDGTMIYPGEFIPVFEKNGSIMKLDFRMLERTCEMLSELIREGIEPVCISVNFSRLHIFSPNFLHDLCAIVDDFGIPRELIELEITESAVLDDEKALIEFLDEIHSSGFTLAMDDFGTGYSSLGSLKNMPIDTLKLDRSFFVNSRDSKRSNAVVESIAEMTKKLNMKTVVEGIEEKSQIDLLKSLGYEVAQGYYYSKPIPSKDFKALLSRRGND